MTLEAPDDPKLYRVSDAAKLLGVSRTYLYELIAKGEVPAIKLGSTTRIPKRELEAVIAAKIEQMRRDLQAMEERSTGS